VGSLHGRAAKTRAQSAFDFPPESCIFAPMTSAPAFLSRLLCLMLLATGAASAGSAPTEYIICTGGPALRKWENLRRAEEQHDRWWGNFVRPSRVRMQELQKTLPPGTIITWLVYRDSYLRRSVEDHTSLTSNVESVRDTYHINLVWFRTGDDVINYINNGGQGISRSRTKISGFEYFGHSNKFCFLFDYSSDIYASSTAWLHQSDLNRISRSAFARGASCQSWGCHTGESMAGAWRKATGATMVGAIGKTDYSNMHLRDWHVGLSPGSRWTR
jgi:hypothetical protein